MARDKVTFQVPSTYTNLSYCGAGTFAVVCQATTVEPTPRTVAIKRIANIWLQSVTPGAPSEFSNDYRLHYSTRLCREVEILCFFRESPQIIPLLDMWMSDDRRDLYLVFPFVSRTLMAVAKDGENGEDLVKWIMFQMLLGLDVLHRCSVLHRDLSLANLLFDDDGSKVVIADFGLSRAKHDANEDISLDVVTLPYRSPELLLQAPRYTNRVDIWSAGCIMAELFLHQPFLANERNDALKQLNTIFYFITGFPPDDVLQESSESARAYYTKFRLSELEKGRPLPSKAASLRPLFAGKCEISDDALRFLERCLTLNFHQRPSAQELLDDPWFAVSAVEGEETDDYFTPMRTAHIEEQRWRQPMASAVDAIAKPKGIEVLGRLAEWLGGQCSQFTRDAPMVVHQVPLTEPIPTKFI